MEKAMAWPYEEQEGDRIVCLGKELLKGKKSKTAVHHDK